MDKLESIVSMLDYALYSKRRKQIVGGILLSISLFFGGLAITVITLKEDKRKHEQIE